MQNISSFFRIGIRVLLQKHLSNTGIGIDLDIFGCGGQIWPPKVSVWAYIVGMFQGQSLLTGPAKQQT